jgi:hypothetical protein
MRKLHEVVVRVVEEVRVGDVAEVMRPEHLDAVERLARKGRAKPWVHLATGGAFAGTRDPA